MSGSSAGGYAAILYGSILKVERVFAFNPQVELTSLLTKSNEKTNPLIFRLKDGPYRKYFDIVPFIMPMMNIYYFFPINPDGTSSSGHIWETQRESIYCHLDQHIMVSFLESGSSCHIKYGRYTIKEV